MADQADRPPTLLDSSEQRAVGSSGYSLLAPTHEPTGLDAHLLSIFASFGMDIEVSGVGTVRPGFAQLAVIDDGSSIDDIIRVGVGQPRSGSAQIRQAEHSAKPQHNNTVVSLHHDLSDMQDDESTEDEDDDDDGIGGGVVAQAAVVLPPGFESSGLDASGTGMELSGNSSN
jgi:hypothetical protein